MRSMGTKIKNTALFILQAFTLIAYSTAFAATGAVFTSFDATQNGCLDNQNGVNCNNYTAKEKVYISGGPAQGNSGLGEGDYYFTVIVPGYQNNGFVDGVEGNLSDTTAGGTAGDAGSGDLISNRTFHIDDTGHISSYLGTHANSISPSSPNYNAGLMSPQGQLLIQLMPFDNTSNSGGVYILAICSVGATSPSDCKYDAFRIDTGSGQGSEFTLSGLKYYDANTNGIWDIDEVGISNWPILYQNNSDMVDIEILTDTNGTFSLTLANGDYHFEEIVGASPWIQTGNIQDQSTVIGTGTVTLNPDKSYDISVTDTGVISGINFGNVCVGKGGAKSIGFWSSKNCKSVFGANDLTLLASLNLVDALGNNFDPLQYSDFRTWLLNANAINMAYLLSAQLAVMELNVLHGFVNGTALVYAPNTNSANASGFASVNDLMNEANIELGIHTLVLMGDPNRSYQEALKNALHKANNNKSFVQPTAKYCPVPKPHNKCIKIYHSSHKYKDHYGSKNKDRDYHYICPKKCERKSGSYHGK